MKLYVDTSALLCRYFNEAESDEVLRVFREPHAKIVGGLVFVELASAFRRAYRAKKISSREHALLAEAARQDLKHFRVFSGGEEVFRQAALVADTTGLRSLDAVHLACARMAGADLLMSLDREMLRAARALGMAVWA